MTKAGALDDVPCDGEVLSPTADAQLNGSWQAMQRAAQRARTVAMETGTALILLRGGKVVRVHPQRDGWAEDAQRLVKEGDDALM